MSDISDDDTVDQNNIQHKFSKAAEYIQLNYSTFTSNDLLELYALYKQSTVGKCNIPKPGIFSIQARSKWDAWNKLGDLDNSKAMELYIEKVTALAPNWYQNENDSKKSQWVCTSIHSKDDEEEISEREKTPFDYLKENNLEILKSIVNKENVNKIKDECGMFLIHWATDRNATDILEYLISLNADLNVQDAELQTPLHYASVCGHMKCIQILLQNGAKKTILDIDGQSCIDVAYDDTIKNFLLN